MNMFEQASRQKLRFLTSRGVLSVEDLWDLPLTSGAGKANLDTIAIGLYKKLNESKDVASFVDNSTATDPIVQLMFDVVKHIIDTRKAENAKALDEKRRSEKKQLILAALARKRENAIEQASEEDLQKMLAEL